MGWINGHRDGHKHSHIDSATGRNKRDKVTKRENTAAPERRSDGSGKIASRAESGRKMRVERAIRRRSR